MKLNTKVVTGSVKLNYVNIKEARSNALSSEPKYSITIIIHKESNTMIKSMKEYTMLLKMDLIYGVGKFQII